MLVCNEQGGLSDKIGGVRIQDNKTTFTELRTMIEEVEINGMRRRTQFFPEVLYHMMNSPNPHGWAPEQLRHYHFGLIEAPGQPPALVPAAAEGRRVTELVPDLVAQDVVLVPQSQVSANGECTPIPVGQTSQQEGGHQSGDANWAAGGGDAPSADSGSTSSGQLPFHPSMEERGEMMMMSESKSSRSSNKKAYGDLIQHHHNNILTTTEIGSYEDKS